MDIDAFLPTLLPALASAVAVLAMIRFAAVLPASSRHAVLALAGTTVVMSLSYWLQVFGVVEPMTAALLRRGASVAWYGAMIWMAADRRHTVKRDRKVARRFADELTGS